MDKISEPACSVCLATLSIFSKQEHIDLIKIIANQENEIRYDMTPQFVMNRLHLSTRELNSGIEKLMTSRCVDMINGRYTLTRLGNEIYNALCGIENAIDVRTELESIDRIILK